MIKVVIVSKGGAIQDVYSNENVDIEIIDMDERELDPKEIEGLKTVY